MRTTLRRLRPLLLVVPALLTTPLFAGDTPAEDVTPPAVTEADEALDELSGKLDWSARADEPPRAYLVAGEHRIELVGFDAPSAKKLRRKVVTARGRLDTPGKVLVLDDGKDLVLQERHEVTGTVTESEDVKSGLLLVAADGREYEVDRRDASKFKEWIGRHVAAQTQRVKVPGHAALVDVKAVERRLLPGEREPDSGESALAGAWTGSMLAEKVPSGVPGVKAGDSFALAFVTDAELEETSGRLFATYDVVGLRLRKWKERTRTVEAELSYTFGQGNHAVRLEGTFSADWKTYTGSWSSSFLGSGTFELRFTEPKTN